MPQASAQVLVESTIELTQPAVKIDEIRAIVQDLVCTVIADKVIFQGVLHKQIFFVRQADNVVVHQAEDVRFSGFIDVPGAVAGATCAVNATVEFIDFELLDPTTLEQKVVLRVTVETPAPVCPTLMMMSDPQPRQFFANRGTAFVSGTGMATALASPGFHSRTGRSSSTLFSTLAGRRPPQSPL